MSSTWALFDLGGFKLTWKHLECISYASNILSYCKPCHIPEWHKFQIQKITGYWFWKLLWNTSSLLPSLQERNYIGAVCRALLPFSWELLTPHSAQPTSAKIFMVLVHTWEPTQSNFSSVKTFFGLALDLSFNIFFLFSISYFDTALLTWNIFYTTSVFVPPPPPRCILCTSIATEQSLFNRIHLSYALPTCCLYDTNTCMGAYLTF